MTVTDPANHSKTFTMDANGNLTSVQEPDPQLGNVTTTYAYDVLNHLIQVTMPRGGTTQIRSFNYLPPSTHTVGGDLLSATNPENGTVNHTYSRYGMLATKTDYKNQQVKYTYDSYNRVTQVQRYLAGGAEDTGQQTNYFYDSNPFDSNQTFSVNTWGRLAAIVYGPTSSNTSWQEWYGYNSAAPTQKRLQINQFLKWQNAQGYWQNTIQKMNFDASYTYDSKGEGKIASVTYPSTTYESDQQGDLGTQAGPTYNYTFDTMGRLAGATDQNNNTVVSSVSYGAANELLTIG